MHIYGIRDDKAQALASPTLFLFPHVAAAIRMFGDIITDPNTALNKHPEDYTLVCLGSMDEDTQIITPEPAHRMTILRGADYIKQTTEHAPLNLVKES